MFSDRSSTGSYRDRATGEGPGNADIPAYGLAAAQSYVPRDRLIAVEAVARVHASVVARRGSLHM